LGNLVTPPKRPENSRQTKFFSQLPLILIYSELIYIVANDFIPEAGSR
jgi:hypothetical protein